MLSRLELNPIVLIALHAIEIYTLTIVAIIQGRKEDRKRLVALMDAQPFGNGYIIVQIIAAGKHRLIINQKFGKAQPCCVMNCMVHTRNSHQSLIGTQIDLTLGITNGAIEIELRTEQSVLTGIIAEGLGLRIEDGESIIRGYPQHTLVILYNTLHGIVG